MRSILKLAISNVLHKKTQSFFIILLIVMATISFSTSVGIITGIKDPFEKTHSKLKASHLLLMLDNEIYKESKILNWWKNRDNIDSIADKMPMKILNNPYLNGNKTEMQLFMTEYVDSLDVQDKLMIVEGEDKTSPSMDEIWINTGLANSEEIEIGDILRLYTKNGLTELKVSAIVVDATFSTPMITPTRVWVASGFLKENYSREDLNLSFVGIRLKDIEWMDDELMAFETYLGGPFNGYIYDYEMVKSSYSFLFQLMGVLMLVFSILLMLITFYILYAIILDSITSEYKNIGIAKLIGFTPGNVVSVYVLQQFITTIIAVFIGLAISYFIIGLMLGSVMESLGIVKESSGILVMLILVGLLLIGLITVFAYVMSLKAAKVGVAEAIRYGENIDNKDLKYLSIKKFKFIPLTALIGINQLISNKRQSLFTCCAIFFTIFVAVFSINTYESFVGISSNRSIFGFDSSDVTIEAKNISYKVDNDSIIQYLESHNNVKAYSQMVWYAQAVVPKDEVNSSMNIFGSLHDSSAQQLGFSLVDGRNPLNRKEIAISVKTSKHYGKSVGQQFQLYINGSLRTFKIVGFYQSSNDMGHGFRLYHTAVQSEEINQFLVKLKDTSKAELFIKELEEKYKNNIAIYDTGASFKEEIEPILTGVGGVILFISIIFILLLVLTIISSTILFVHKNKKTFGIYKTIGFSPKQVKLSLIVKNTILFVTAALPAVLSAILVLPVTLKLMSSSAGIFEFPGELNFGLTATIVPIVYGVICLSTWIPSNRIMNLKLRNLLT